MNPIHAERLQEGFRLALDDLYEANAAAQICLSFNNKHEQLCGEALERQQVWGFVEQAVSWKLALALARLTQHADMDRASLDGLIREINAVRQKGTRFADERRIRQAEADLATARAADICTTLRNSRNAFVGHSLIGKCRKGIRVLDLIDYLSALELVAEGLHEGVFGVCPDFDSNLDNWQAFTSAWFNQMLP